MAGWQKSCLLARALEALDALEPREEDLVIVGGKHVFLALHRSELDVCEDGRALDYANNRAVANEVQKVRDVALRNDVKLVLRAVLIEEVPLRAMDSIDCSKIVTGR